MNASKLGTNEIPGWRGAEKNLLVSPVKYYSRVSIIGACNTSSAYLFQQSLDDDKFTASSSSH